MPDHLCHRVLRALHTLMDLTQREIAKFPSVQASGVYSALTSAHWPFSVWPSAYWCTAALKSLDVWWYEASAVYYALSIDQIVTPFGLWLLGFPDLLALLSRASIALEFLGPCLVFVPFCTPWLRIFVVGAFFGFHIGLALCMSIGLFPYVSMVSWLVFVPSLKRGSPQTTPPLQATRLSRALAAFFLVYGMLWNLRGIEATSPYVRQIFPPYANLVGYLLRLDQYWNMFSPYPPKADGWFVMPGTLKDGHRVELWTGERGVSWEKPSNISALYPNDRWWKFMENIYPGQREREAALDAYARYLCRDWNTRHSGQGQLETFRIFFMQETTLPNYQDIQPEKKLLGTHSYSVNNSRATSSKAL